MKKKGEKIQTENLLYEKKNNSIYFSNYLKLNWKMLFLFWVVQKTLMLLNWLCCFRLFMELRKLCLLRFSIIAID